MNKLRLLGVVCACIFTSFTTTTSAALVDNGGGLIYDDVLKITWAQPDAGRTWDSADSWASGLTLGGVSGWRLPYISVAAGAGPFTGTPVDCSPLNNEEACRDNELGYIFYHNFGGTFGQSILTSGDPDLALFPTLQSFAYWSGTEFVNSNAWSFNFNSGNQGNDHYINGFYSWAVHAGNVGAVPIPPALLLFGSGLLGLIGMAKRKTA